MDASIPADGSPLRLCPEARAGSAFRLGERGHLQAGSCSQAELVDVAGILMRRAGAGELKANERQTAPPCRAGLYQATLRDDTLVSTPEVVSGFLPVEGLGSGCSFKDMAVWPGLGACACPLSHTLVKAHVRDTFLSTQQAPCERHIHVYRASTLCYVLITTQAEFCSILCPPDCSDSA